mgnify:FL=1
MKPTEFIWNAGGKKKIEKIKPYIWMGRQCCFCGEVRNSRHDIIYRRDDVLSSAFNNWDCLQNAGSEWICNACAWCFCKHLRCSSLIVTENEIGKIKREDVAATLFSPPKPPFVLMITYSFKKHNAIRARISLSQKNYHIRIEDKECWFDVDVWKPVFENMQTLYSVMDSEKEKKEPKTWFTKKEILTGAYQINRVMSFGREKLFEIDAKLKQYRGQVAYELLVYALNVKKD